MALALSLVTALGVSYGLALVALAALLFAFGVFVGLRHWRWSICGLLAYLPLSGIPVILSYPHTTAPVLLKDLLFVVPAYLGYVTAQLSRRRPLGFEGAPKILLGLFALLTVLQALNPGLPSVLVGAVGIKVWLFYVPLLFLGYHLIGERADLDRLLKLMALAAVVPLVIGIIEGVLIAGGHAQDVYRFYGAAAGPVTQNFAETTYAGGGALRRVPSTFSFVTQYYVFAASMVAVTYAWWRSAGSRSSKRWRAVLWVLALCAALLSGARGAFLFVPFLVVLTSVLEYGLTRIPVARISVALGALLVAVSALGGHVGVVLLQTVGVGRSEAGPGFFNGLGYVFGNVPLGAGTGIDTTAARYVLPSSGVGLIGGQESWYIKAAVELGVGGLVLVVVLVGTLVGHGVRCHRQLRDARLRAVSASLLALLIWNAIYGLKGSYIDLDPADVYFWLLAGVLFKLPTLATRESGASSSAPQASLS